MACPSFPEQNGQVWNLLGKSPVISSTPGLLEEPTGRAEPRICAILAPKDGLEARPQTRKYLSRIGGHGESLRISAVIPVYNEEEVIDEFSSRLTSALEKIDPDYEAIFIVEGKDATREKLATMSKDNPRIKVHYIEERLGLGKAMKKGFGLVDDRAEYVLTMDADLNHQPEEIQNLMAATEKAEIVVGSRNADNGMVQELPLVKRIISATTNWTMRKIFHIPSNDVTSGFRIYSCKAVDALKEEIVAKNFEIQPELLIRARRKGLPIADVPITFLLRPRGTSKLSFVKSGIGYVMLIVRLGF